MNANNTTSGIILSFSWSNPPSQAIVESASDDEDDDFCSLAGPCKASRPPQPPRLVLLSFCSSLPASITCVTIESIVSTRK